MKNDESNDLDKKEKQKGEKGKTVGWVTRSCVKSTGQ